VCVIASGRWWTPVTRAQGAATPLPPVESFPRPLWVCVIAPRTAAKVCEFSRDFRVGDLAHAAVSRRPPIFLDRIVARAEGYAYDVGVLGFVHRSRILFCRPVPKRRDSQLLHRRSAQCVGAREMERKGDRVCRTQLVKGRHRDTNRQPPPQLEAPPRYFSPSFGLTDRSLFLPRAEDPLAGARFGRCAVVGR
jgi:hypothetical protein